MRREHCTGYSRTPRSRCRTAARHRTVRACSRSVPVGRDRRRRVQGDAFEQRHLRSASGRHQPDGAHQVARRQHHARATRHHGPSRRNLFARLGPHHNPAERADPLCRSHQGHRRHACARLGGFDHSRGVWRHRSQCHGLPSGRGLPSRVPRRHAVGRGRVPALRSQPVEPTPAAQVQDQLLRLLDRLRSGDVQRRRRDRRDAHPRRWLDRDRVPSVHRRRPRRQPASGVGTRRLHITRRSPAHDRVRPTGVRPDRQPRQQAARPPQVGRRSTWHRRASAPGAEGAQHAARVFVVAGRYPGDRPEGGRCARRAFQHCRSNCSRSGCERLVDTS